MGMDMNFRMETYILFSQKRGQVHFGESVDQLIIKETGKSEVIAT